MKNNKKTALLLVVVLLVALTTAIVGFTYSRYLSSATGTSTAKVAKWAVKVNDTDIIQNKTFTLDSKYITWNSSDKVANGYIAPGSTGTMKIKLDTTGSQVAVKYTISVDATALDKYSQIKITTINGAPVTDNTYTGTIALADVDTPVEIPIVITWENNDATNESDTTIGSTIEELEIPINVTVEQAL